MAVTGGPLPCREPLALQRQAGPLGARLEDEKRRMVALVWLPASPPFYWLVAEVDLVLRLLLLHLFLLCLLL